MKFKIVVVLALFSSSSWTIDCPPNYLCREKTPDELLQEDCEEFCSQRSDYEPPYQWYFNKEGYLICHCPISATPTPIITPTPMIEKCDSVLVSKTGEGFYVRQVHEYRWCCHKNMKEDCSFEYLKAKNKRAESK